MKDAERRATLADNAYEHRKQAERFVEERVEKITRKRVGVQKTREENYFHKLSKYNKPGKIILF